MAGYLYEILIDDSDENLGEEAVDDCVQQMIDAVDFSPFNISIINVEKFEND